MTQSVNIGVALGAAKTGETIGYRLLNLDGTTYAAFTTTNVAETSVAGTYVVTTAVTAPDAGARIVWGPSGTDYVASIIDPVPSVNLVDGAITAAKIANDAITDAKVAADVTIASVTGAVGSVTGNVGGNVVGSVGSLATQAKADVNAEVDTAISDAALATASALATVDTVVDAILADTGTDGVVIATGAITAATIATDAIDADALAADAIAEINATVDTAIGDAALATAAALATVDSNVDAILADTNELQTDWADAGRLDAILDARASQASVDALNDLSTADIDARLAAYDAPTKAEMDAGFAALNDPTAAAIADAVWDESTTGHVTSGTFGEQLKTDVDAILADTGTDGVIVASIAANAVNASALATDAVTEIQSGLATSSALATVDMVVDAILDDTGTSGVVVATASKTGYSLSSAGVQAIWDALTSALTTVGSIGKRLADNIDATIGSRSTVTTAQVNSEVDTALADYDAPTKAELDSAVAPLATASALTTVDSVVDAIKAVADLLPDGGALTTLLGNVSSILADSNELQADWTNGGRLDLLIDAIKAKTDNLPPDPADASDIAASFAALNDLDSTAVQSAAAAALTAYDPPTKAELDAAQTTITNAIVALNDLSTADIDARLTAYDAATGTEAAAISAAIAALNDLAASDVWTYATRTLTQSAASVTAAVTGSTLAVVRSATFDGTLTGITVPGGWTTARFTIKTRANKTQADATSALLQILVTDGGDAGDGLVVLNSSTSGLTAADASLTVNASSVDIHIEDAATASLAIGGYEYDVKFYHGTSDSTVVTAGICNVTSTPTETI